MGHYDDCYQADAERRRKERIEQLNKDIKLEMKGRSLEDLETLAIVSEHIKAVREFAGVITKISGKGSLY